MNIEEALKKLDLNMCYQCGTCTGTCPVARVESAFNPRRLIDEARLYGVDHVLNKEELWFCTECFMCMEKCPQKVKITEIILALWEEAVKRGIKIPQKFVGLAKAVASTGISTGAYGGKGTALSGMILKKREKLGLPIPKIKQEVAKDIVESTGVLEILEGKSKEGGE